VSPTDDVAALAHLRLIDAPDVFYFDRVTPWALELAERCRRAGTLVVFEPSTIGGDLATFKRAIRAAHVLKYADDRIADMQDVDLSCVDVEIQTHGKEGLKFRVAEQAGGWHHLSAFMVPYIADTAGAGDWCTSGFLYALVGSIIENGGRGQLSTRRVKESLRFGQILAALNCMEKGARGLARRHRAEQLVTLATSIRNSMASSIPQATKTANAESAGANEAAPLTTTGGISSLLCCEALAG
jgi:fructokinase